MKALNVMVSVIFLGCLSGCGCGDTVAARKLVLTEHRGVSSGDDWGPFIIDTSQLPPDAISKRVEKKDVCGGPITELLIFPNRPIKIVLMPTAQP